MRRILIVDWEKSAREAMAMRAALAGADCIAVANSTEAAQWIRRAAEDERNPFGMIIAGTTALAADLMLRGVREQEVALGLDLARFVLCRSHEDVVPDYPPPADLTLTLPDDDDQLAAELAEAAFDDSPDANYPHGS